MLLSLKKIAEERKLNYKPLTADELKNAKQFPKVYYCRHMEPGVAHYENTNETIMVDTDAMKRMMPSFEGKPVYIGHKPVDLENIHEADGYVTETFYNELDGWAWSKFIVLSDKGHEVINQGWSVSNAYIPTETSKGGKFHNVDFSKKIVNGRFTHLALVPNPRYEEAGILTPEEFKRYQDTKRQELKELHNSKERKPVLKLFKTKKEEITNANEVLDDDVVAELPDGSHVPLAELVNSYKASLQKQEDDKKVIAAEQEIDVDGKKVKLSELVNSFVAKDKKDDKKSEQDNKATDEVKNATEVKKTEQKKEEKEDEKHFDEIANAHKQKQAYKPYETSADMVARGKDRY